MAKTNSYYTSDKELDDIAKKIVIDLYANKDIVDLQNNGRTLKGAIGTMTERNISGLYSNITGHKTVQTILTNAIRYAVLVEKNVHNESEFKKIREACERRKNVLSILNRKYENEPTESIISELEKTKEEISLLENQMNEIANKNTDKPEIKKSILELAKKAYGLLLRGDKTSEKLFVAICKHLNVKISKEHFGYDVYQNEEEYKPYYMRNKERNDDKKEDIYIPPALRNNYGHRKHY